ncbi:hypothetical protein Dsin_021746 [Dipteronia sinensis]|uniref:Ribonuclease H n=1 Tax=Dipteronia sinensis TaxID=43782 RepID=A0AAE0A1J2_9ROSI|nr:hypothetical protein Dsin_021746 [Dipteronia sinensis]
MKKKEEIDLTPAVPIWEEYPEYDPLSFQPNEDALDYVTLVKASPILFLASKQMHRKEDFGLVGLFTGFIWAWAAIPPSAQQLNPAGSHYFAYMAKKSVYVVFKGRKAGVFNSWPNCHEQVNGFKGASYKKFNTVDEAYEAIRAVQLEKLSNHTSGTTEDKGDGGILKSNIFFCNFSTRLYSPFSSLSLASNCTCKLIISASKFWTFPINTALSTVRRPAFARSSRMASSF